MGWWDKMARTLLAVVCLFLAMKRIRGYSLGIDVSPKQDLTTGSLFTIHCDVNPRDDHVIIQVVKTIVRLKLPDGERVYGSADKPVVISNDTNLDPALQRVTDRYMVEEDAPGKVVLSVEDAQPEDSGFWGCRLINKDTDSIQMEPIILNVLVRGDLQKLSIAHSSDVWHKDESSLQGTVHVQEGVPFNMYCLIQMTNVVPVTSITIHSLDGHMQENLTKSIVTQSQVLGEIEDGMLVKTTVDLRLKHSDGEGFKALYTYHNKEYVCHAQVHPYPAFMANVTLNVTFYPRELKCERQMFGGPTGTRDFQMTCSVKSNPTPRFNWRGPTGLNLEDSGVVGNYNLTIQVGQDSVYISTLTISEVKDIHHGEYFIHTTNKLGAKSTTILLVNRVIAAASVPEQAFWIQLVCLGAWVSVRW